MICLGVWLYELRSRLGISRMKLEEIEAEAEDLAYSGA